MKLRCGIFCWRPEDAAWSIAQSAAVNSTVFFPDYIVMTDPTAHCGVRPSSRRSLAADVNIHSHSPYMLYYCLVINARAGVKKLRASERLASRRSNNGRKQLINLWPVTTHRAARISNCRTYSLYPDCFTAFFSVSVFFLVFSYRLSFRFSFSVLGLLHLP